MIIYELYQVYFVVTPDRVQIREVESRLRHKLYPPNAWMKVLHFSVLTSCPKDELHQWFLGLYGEHIIPAIVHRYTQILQRPDLVTVDKNRISTNICQTGWVDLRDGTLKGL